MQHDDDDDDDDDPGDDDDEMKMEVCGAAAACGHCHRAAPVDRHSPQDLACPPFSSITKSFLHVFTFTREFSALGHLIVSI